MPDFRKIPLGAHKDPEDPRDVIKRVQPLLAAASAPLPRSARVRDLPPIKNQGMQSSCTGHAVTWMWEQILRSRKEPAAGIILSPLYTWYYGRASEGNQAIDMGVTMRGAMKALAQHGACPIDLWPYGSAIDLEPSSTAAVTGEALRLPRYERCEDLQTIRHAIGVEDQSVVVSLPIYDSWYSDWTRRTGKVLMPPKKTSEPHGYHAMTICGYDDSTSTLLLANSWGTEYGDHGYVHVPYDYFEIPDYYDAWSPGFDDLPDAKN